MKKSYVIGGAVVVLALTMAMYSFKSTLTSYVSVTEAKASKRPVQVAGIVVEGTDEYDLKSNNLLFTLPVHSQKRICQLMLGDMQKDILQN